MKILMLTLQNFLSYRGELAVPLADQGLVLVRGDNRLSAAADSNGAGKSALFAALSMALYGETLTGQRGDEVICRFAPAHAPCTLEVHIEDAPDCRWLIRRTRRPATLTVPGAPTTLDARGLQEYINDRLGMGFRTFRNAVVFGQGAFERFTQADQGDQLRMLDEIQGLDLRGALDRARTWRAEAQQRVEHQQQELEALDREMSLLDETRASLDRARAAFETTKRERIAAAEERLRALQAQTIEHARLVQAARTAEAQVARTRKAIEARTKAEQTRAGLMHKIALAQGGLTRCGAEMVGHQQTLVELLASRECPTCHQPANPKALRQTFEGLLSVLKEQQGATRAAIRHYEDEVGLVDKVLANTPRPEDLGSLQAHAANLPSLKGSLKVLQDRVRQGEEDLAGERIARWDGAQALGAAEAQGVRIRDQRKEAEEALGRATATLQAADYWVEAFGDRGIRSLLVDSVAGFLNTRLRHHLSILAAGEVETTLSAQTALKGGGLRERLSIASAWAWGGTLKGSGSAGQDRRVDLALFAALQDLAESRAARPFPLRIWDEPGDALDSRGQELFVRWVSREARARGTGFLVTHNPSLAEAVLPDQTWTVTLDSTGSHLTRTKGGA